MLDGVRIMARRGVDDIQREFKRLLQHVRYDAVEERAAAVEAGIGIDLDKPGLARPIKHEV